MTGSMSYSTVSQSLSRMSPDTIAAIFGGVSILLSWAGSAFIAGYRWGTVKTRLDMMELQVNTLATKDQLAGVKEDVAEIKGMFRLTPKDGGHGI